MSDEISVRTVSRDRAIRIAGKMLKRWPLTMKAVARGVDALRTNDPKWYYSIDLDILDMDTIHHCVVGQRFGSYILGKVALGLNGEDGSKYGFLPLWREECDMLKEIWQVAILWLIMNDPEIVVYSDRGTPDPSWVPVFLSRLGALRISK